MKIEIPSQGRVLGFYGADAQAMVHCEELAELIQAISKMRRGCAGSGTKARTTPMLTTTLWKRSQTS